MEGLMEKLTSLSSCVLDVNKLSQNQLVDLNLYKDQDDEGEIMLLAMILLQLHGVKIPTSTSDEESDLNKKKRQRTSPDQLAILEQIFQTDKMPNQQTRVHLADQLGMSSRRVQIWFQNKRAKVKRSVSKPDGDSSDSSSSSPLHDSSSLIVPSSPSSPSSPSPFPSLDIESPLGSPTLNAAVVPQMNPLKRTLSSLEAPIIIPSNVPTLPSNSTTDIIIDATKHLKAQMQFSRTPFVDNQPVLTASY